MENRKYELVIFDCDGTLVDSEPLTNRLIAEMITERGIQMNQDESLRLFAGKTLKHITSFIEEHGVQVDEDKFEYEYRDRCQQLFHEELEAIPGVEDLIKSLTVPYCIASNGPKKKMEVTLPAAGLQKYFSIDRIFSAYDINHWKPEPELFLHVASSMNVTPSKSIVIEDTLSGLMGAVNGGIDVIAYNPHNDQRMFVDNVPNYKSMDEIQSYLSTHFN